MLSKVVNYPKNYSILYTVSFPTIIVQFNTDIHVSESVKSHKY